MNEKKYKNNRGRVLKVQKQTGAVFEVNRSHRQMNSTFNSCGGTTRNTPSDQEIDRIIIAHDMVSAIINKIKGKCRNILSPGGDVFRQTTHSFKIYVGTQT